MVPPASAVPVSPCGAAGRTVAERSLLSSLAPPPAVGLVGSAGARAGAGGPGTPAPAGARAGAGGAGPRSTVRAAEIAVHERYTATTRYAYAPSAATSSVQAVAP